MPTYLNVARLKVITNNFKSEKRYTMQPIMPNGDARRAKMISNIKDYQANQAFENEDALKSTTVNSWEANVCDKSLELHYKYRPTDPSTKITYDTLISEFDFNKDFKISKALLSSMKPEDLLSDKRTVMADLLEIGMNINS
jgi:hypothetical protein